MIIRQGDNSSPDQSAGSGFLNRLERGWDRVMTIFAPQHAARNMYARVQMSMASDFLQSGGFDAADRSSREMGNWTPLPTDADSSMEGLDDIRSRSRDAYRNQPLAGGLVNTTVMNAVGIGLTLQSRLDRDVLTMTDDEADAAQDHIDRRFRLWATSKNCDLERKLTFNGHVRLALQCRCVNGESLTLLPFKELRGLSNPLRLQAIESDRLSNPSSTPDSKNRVGGIDKDDDGAPLRYWINRSHPGNILYADPSRWAWDPYDAFNPRTGLPNVLHYYRIDRPGQTRGYPLLAPILEPLKDLSRMTKAELKRAVVSALFTVFIKSNSQPLGNSPLSPALQQAGGPSVAYGQGDQSAAKTGNIRLGFGSIIGLTPNQEIVTADPKLPNQNFDPFFLANVRQIGLQVGIPYEVLIKHYTASYSAARAAIEDAWSYFLFMRSELVENFCDPVYAVWFAQEVAQGTIYAPGFFADDMIRAAWLGHKWNGPSKPIINPVDEMDAAKKRTDLGITTLVDETASYNGGDWQANIKQRGKEESCRSAAGLPPLDAKVSAPQPASPAQNQDLPEVA